MVDIRIPDDYPTDPPLVRFATKILHPNVDSENGNIRLDILAQKWRPEMTILTVLTALYSLLVKPNLFYPQDIPTGFMYFQDFFEFRSKAILWTRAYA